MSDPVIHPAACVEEGAKGGAGSEIGAFAYVGAGVVLGEGCKVGPQAVVLGNTTVGNGTYIHPHAVVGGAPQDLKYEGTDTRLLIGERNRIREGVTINTGTESGGRVTVLGSDNVLMANAHVAHDCILGSRIILANNVMLAGHVRVHDGAILNAHSGKCLGVKRDDGRRRRTHDVSPIRLIT